MSPWINYHHLYYFKVIAEEQSVSRAAEKLRLGQPTLSAQLKQFESTLGVQLFERQHKKLVLSEQGRVALEYARDIFRMGGEMYEVLHDKIVPSRVHLQVGSLDSVPKQVVLQLAKAAYKAGPCQVSLIEGKSDELLRELVAHRLDLLLTNFLPTPQEAKGLTHRSLAKKPVGIYGAPKFRSLKKDFPASLAGQQFVMPTYDSKMRYDIEHWFATHKLGIDIIAETQDIGLKKLMAVDGIGLIPAGAQTVTRQVLGGELIEIGRLTGVSEELFIVSASRKRTNPIAASLMRSFAI